VAMPLNVPKHAFTLQLLFQDAQRLIDIVVANQNCKVFPSAGEQTAARAKLPNASASRRGFSPKEQLSVARRNPEGCAAQP